MQQSIKPEIRKSPKSGDVLVIANSCMIPRDNIAVTEHIFNNYIILKNIFDHFMVQPQNR